MEKEYGDSTSNEYETNDRRDGFVFMGSYLETAEALDKINPSLGDELLMTIVVYGITGQDVSVTPSVRAAFCNIKVLIDKNREKYKATIKRKEEYQKRCMMKK